MARRLGLKCIQPRVLHESKHASIHLYPLDIVARVAFVEHGAGVQRLERELCVARHLVSKFAPVVAPGIGFPAGPHLEGEFVLTLWQFARHMPAVGDEPEHILGAAKALRAVHAALADYPEELPLLWSKIDSCRALLNDERDSPALPTADRAFLSATHDKLRAQLAGRPMSVAPIHGDAHAGNVFITSDGVLWNDFEDVCIGPREWDIGWLSDNSLSLFEPVDREVLILLQDLRSLCAAVWCWALFDREEKREAAEYHLGRLKARYVSKCLGDNALDACGSMRSRGDCDVLRRQP